MHLEEFAEGVTVIHRLDPRVKILTVLPFILITATTTSLTKPLYALIIGIVLSAIARLDISKLTQRLIAVNLFVLTLWIFVPFSYPGEPAFSIGPFTASKAGLLYVNIITIKTNAIVLMTIAMLGTTEAFSLAHALLHLKAPTKLVHLFFFFYRYISVLHEEYTRLRASMKVRAFRPSSNMHTYRSFAYLIGMLLVRSHERSGRIHEAMLCRGFYGYYPVAQHFHTHNIDYIFVASATCAIATMIII